MTASEKLKSLLLKATYYRSCAEAGLEALHRRNSIILHRHELQRQHEAKRDEQSSAQRDSKLQELTDKS